MQLLILNANSIIWSVGKSCNWNHMKKHFEKKILMLRGNGIGEKMRMENGKISTKRKIGKMRNKDGLDAFNLVHQLYGKTDY